MCSVEKRGSIFILTLLHNNETETEHRLSPTLITALRSAVGDIRSQSLSSPNSSSALITTSTGRFFSNGFDLKWAQSGGKPSFLDRLHHIVDTFKPVIADLISLPMPTIAAVNGHAAAAGLALALSHDYLLMRKDKGVLYMSEVDIGLTFPEYFNVLFKEKVGWKARREIMMKGMKLKGEEGVKLGIVDRVFESEKEVFEKGIELGEELVKRKWDGEVFAEIRKGLFPELTSELGLSRNSLVRPKL